MQIDLERITTLDGAVALVTGASSGLGERFARVLHAAGANVVLTARRADRLDAIVDDLGDRAASHAADLDDDEQREQLVSSSIARHGHVDILVNNAGISRTSPAEDESLDTFRDVLELNLVAPFHLAQLCARSMLGRGSGAIVNVASMYGLVASSPIQQASYSASKGAVVNLTRELAAQWAGRGVHVNALAPGWYQSEMTANMWNDDRSLRFVERGTPVGRRAQPHELDAALLLLAGAGGSYITGQTLVVDGGWTIS